MADQNSDLENPLIVERYPFCPCPFLQTKTSGDPARPSATPRDPARPCATLRDTARRPVQSGPMCLCAYVPACTLAAHCSLDTQS